MKPLAEAGFEVIVPDLRGYGDSDLSAKDQYDLTLYSRDLYALVHDVLGHEGCGLIGGDVGGAVICDLANRFPGFVDRMIFFNTVAPLVLDQPAWYAERGLSLVPLEHGPTGDYRIRQGRDWKQLFEELDTPARRRRYVRDFYEHRLLASPYSFEEDDYDFMTEPFEDARRLAAGWAPYQFEYGRPMSEPPLVRSAAEHDPRRVRGALLRRSDVVAASQPGAPEGEKIARVREALADAAYTTRVAKAAVTWAWESSGSAGIRNPSKLQRCFRDLYVGASHQVFDERTFIESGKQMLGIEI